jgi:ABC-type sugar transport system substrate-binding protein
VIVCANDDMPLGAVVAFKSRNLVSKVALIGFDALPEALGEVKACNLTATMEQPPGRPELPPCRHSCCVPLATARSQRNK